MIALVNEHGTRHWGHIGAKLNGRTGKQVTQMTALVKCGVLSLNVVIFFSVENVGIINLIQALTRPRGPMLKKQCS